MNKEENVRNRTRRLTVAGLMAAITILMIYTPIGMIPLPGASLTISHIPAIMTALLFGPVMGAVVGCVFGMTSLIRALTSPLSPLDPLFTNPLVSVLPRILIGIVAWFVYKLFAKLNENLGLLLGAAAGSLTNTIGVLSMLYFLYAKEIVDKLASGDASTTAGTIIWMIITTSGVTEMIAAAVISFPLVKALKKALPL